MNTITTHPLTGILGSCLAWAGALTGSQVQIEWWLRVVSYLAAIGVSCITAYCLLRRNGKVEVGPTDNLPDEPSR